MQAFESIYHKRVLDNLSLSCLAILAHLQTTSVTNFKNSNFKNPEKRKYLSEDKKLSV